MLLGVGVGGFVDGILLHQILQWHHMISAERGRSMRTIAGLEANTVADGLRIHHVRDDVAHPLPWDLGFLVLSGALLWLGWWWARAGELPHPTPDRVPPVPSG